MSEYYSSREAAERLGISRQTLYSYVSRGLLSARSVDSAREHLYVAEEVEDLIRRREEGRSPRRVAKGTLNWGLPVIESSIALIEKGHLYYRGFDVSELIETHTVEAVAALLWQCDVASAFRTDPPELQKRPPQRQRIAAGASTESLLCSFASQGAKVAAAHANGESAAELLLAGDLIRTLAACVLESAPSAAPLHEQCAAAWSLNTREADLLRLALILCADHELNVSSFTVRCIASTGASLNVALVGGLAALSGFRHGGVTSRIEALWTEVERANGVEQALRHRLAQEQRLPGLGHPLYPDGDVRAAEIFRRLIGKRASWKPLLDAAERLTGLRPVIDFALVALRRCLGLPEGSAFRILALGRCMGWIAHALEQQQARQLIRPRANYVGPQPNSSKLDSVSPVGARRIAARR